MLAPERRNAILQRIGRSGRVRSSEIAEELGVAEITIRRDLNSLDTEGLVTRVHGGAIARGPAGRPPNEEAKIGVIVPSSDYYYSQVIQGAAAAAPSLHARLVLGVSRAMKPGQNPVEHMIGLGVDGLLVTPPVSDPEAEEMADWLSDVHVPLVLMERSYGYPHEQEFDHVRSDHAHGARLALHHFHALGRTAVAVALAPTATARPLDEGVRQASEVLEFAHGLRRYALPEEDAPELSDVLADMLNECLAAGVRAFFVHSDYHAARFVDVVQQEDLRIPEDVAVISYDDVIAAHASVALTAISPPKRKVGSTALELLNRRLRFPEQDDPIVHTFLLPSLRIRESCGYPGR